MAWRILELEQYANGSYYLKLQSTEASPMSLRFFQNGCEPPGPSFAQRSIAGLILTGSEPIVGGEYEVTPFDDERGVGLNLKSVASGIRILSNEFPRP